MTFAPHELAVQVAQAVNCHGGRAYMVGGSVRDALLQLPVKDVDLEVFGIGQEQLERALMEVGPVDLVGKQFGVYKLKGTDIDVALPRRERKEGEGHRGFCVEPDPHLSMEAAAMRRDFTINALYLDPVSGDIADPVGGRADLDNRILRHVSDAFLEDPLRVLRGMQMIARFALSIAPETMELCRKIGFEDLPFERVGEEFFKLLTRGTAIGDGLRFLQATGWLQYFPEIAALANCPQDPTWHPEGDVFVHTCHCLDVFAKERTGDATEDWAVGLGVLCHDMGKPITTFYREGRWRSPRHEDRGVPIAERFLERITGEKKLVEEVLPLVAHHMRPFQLHHAQARDSAVRRMADKVKRIDRLIRVCRADKQGRPPLKISSFAELDWLQERAAALDVAASAPQPILLGRDLIPLGIEPGPKMGKILRRAFDAQLDGDFTDHQGGLLWIRAYLGL